MQRMPRMQDKMFYAIKGTSGVSSFSMKGGREREGGEIERGAKRELRAKEKKKLPAPYVLRLIGCDKFSKGATAPLPSGPPALGSGQHTSPTEQKPPVAAIPRLLVGRWHIVDTQHVATPSRHTVIENGTRCISCGAGLTHVPYYNSNSRPICPAHKPLYSLSSPNLANDTGLKT